MYSFGLKMKKWFYSSEITFTELDFIRTSLISVEGKNGGPLWVIYRKLEISIYIIGQTPSGRAQAFSSSYESRLIADSFFRIVSWSSIMWYGPSNQARFLISESKASVFSCRQAKPRLRLL